MIKGLKYFVFLFLTVGMAYAQSPSKSDIDFKAYFKASVNGKGYYITISQINNSNSKKLLKNVRPFLSVDNEKQRFAAIDLLRRKALSLTSAKERGPYIELLIEACKDNDSGISGAASNSLTQFAKSDFSKQHGDSLLALLKRKPYHYERIIKLNGFCQPEGSIKYINDKVLSDSLLTKKGVWAAKLALARMDHRESITYIEETVQQAGINDDIVDYLYPDIIYIRQPEVLRLVLNNILSDDKQCSSPNPDSEESIICAFKIIQLAGPVIRNFPLRITKYGEVDLEDYDKDLQSVRSWLSDTPELVLDEGAF